MTALDLIAAIRYQCLTPSVTTWGPCKGGCAEGARGGGYCRHCLGAQLAELIEPAIAARLVLALSEAGAAIHAAEAAADG